MSVAAGTLFASQAGVSGPGGELLALTPTG
jgi:hypothetical protein